MDQVTKTRTPGWVMRYYVPRSQVYAGSRGGQSGNVHLQVEYIEPERPGLTLTATSGRRTTIERRAGRALCGRSRGWYDREPHPGEAEQDRCPRCVEMAERYGVEWP